MKDYCPDNWQEILRHNHLDSFEALWQLQADWFEPPNQRRGGWSGVVRIELNLPDGGVETVFVKRQENHTRRTLLHPFSGEPTITSEIRNILALQEAGVPTLEPAYFGQRKVDGTWRAMLVTRELSGFRPMNKQMHRWLDDGWNNSIAVRRRFIDVLADAVRRMHDHRLAHNSLHPKHVFVRLVENGDPEVRFIDLEKMRYCITPRRAAKRDLDSLNRRGKFWSEADRLRFLKKYLGTKVLNADGKSFWKYLARRKIRFKQKESAGVD